MMNYDLKIKNGYSIIEIIIYLAIFSAISIFVIKSFVVVVSSFDNTSINRKLLESGTISMERMTREIRQAKSINASTSSSYLILDTTSNSTIGFRNESSNLNLYSGGSLVGNLLGNHVSLSSLTFRKITTTVGSAVKIEMTLSYNNKGTVITKNFYDTVILRGAY